MTNATEKDWKGWELGYGGELKSVAAFSSDTGAGGLWRLPRTGLVCLSNEAHRHRQHPAAETLRVGGTVPPAEKHPPTQPAFRTGVKVRWNFCNFSLKFHRLQLQKCGLFYEFFFIFPNSNLRPSNSLPAISKAKRSLSASRTLSCTARNSCTLAPNALTISSPIFMEE